MNPWWALAIGVALLPFSAHQTVHPLAAVLAPVFLLRFSRRAPSLRLAAAGLLIGIGLATAVSFRGGYLQAPAAALGVAALAVGLVGAPSYLFDRCLGPNLPGWARWLVFPCALTVAEYLVFRFGPSGTWGSLAYSQRFNLPLLQLLSVTGIWGITFLIGGVAPALNELWERGLERRAARRLAALAMLVAVLEGAGALRLLIAERTGGEEIAVAAVAPGSALYRATFADWQVEELAAAGNERRAWARGRFALLHEDLLRRSRTLAAAGARLVAWPETVPVLAEDAADLMARARALARATGAIVVTTPWIVRRADRAPLVDNTSQAFDGTGEPLWRYEKTHLVPWVEDRRQTPGPGVLPVVSAGPLRLAGAICYDLDFPWWVRQSGRAGAALLVAPADDWPAVKTMHAEMAVFRAIENGVSVLRVASNGISLAADPWGRVRAAVDSDRSDAPALLTSLPVVGVRTIYARCGDWFAGLAAGVLASLVVFSRRYDAARGGSSSTGS